MVKETTVVNKKRVTYTQGIMTDLKKGLPNLHPWIESLVGVIPHAQIWHLPETVTDLLLHTTPNAIAMEKVRLPHKLTMLEYNLSLEFGKLEKDQFSCYNRAALLIETDKDIVANFVFKDPEANIWLPIPPIAIPLTAIDNITPWWRPANKGVYVETKFLRFSQLYEDMPKDASAKIIREVVTDIWCVLSFMQISACSNATSINIPVSSKIIKAANRRGKYSPTNYREFSLGNEIQVRRNTYNKNTNMPRETHWRKGHIRWQPTNKGIIRKWIHPTIVGAGVPVSKPIMVKV